ncbi:MAG: L-histidine N(alpha)-methyltransferase, partial [Caulobacteraceae bacterium]
MLHDPFLAHATSLAARYDAVRTRSLALAAPLSAEDQQVQSMPDASPTKWHLAHTTWFFETFLLTPQLASYAVFDETFNYLFNSYYESVGARHPRAERGLLTRPGHDQVLAYRAHVDAAMRQLLGQGLGADALALVELGLNHEEQHQELILMDIKHAFAMNAIAPAYAPPTESSPVGGEGGWSGFEGGLVEIGHDGVGFAFD